VEAGVEVQDFAMWLRGGKISMRRERTLEGSKPRMDPDSEHDRHGGGGGSPPSSCPGAEDRSIQEAKTDQGIAGFVRRALQEQVRRLDREHFRTGGRLKEGSRCALPMRRSAAAMRTMSGLERLSIGQSGRCTTLP